jgi:hypothetical protein
VTNLLDVKENYEHSFDFALYLSRLFRSRRVWTLPCTAHAFFPERLSNHCQVVRRTSSEIYTKFDAVLLSDPSRNPIRPDTRLLIKEH